MALCFFGVGLGAAAEALGAEPSAVRSADRPYLELLAGFREISALEARFEEDKFLAILAAPLRSRGRLYFLPPSTLLRRVEEPDRQEILIHEGRIHLSHGGKTRTIDLAARGELRPLVDSLIWILTGDLESIESFYRVGYEVFDSETDRAGGNRWQLTLTPKRAPLSNLLQELRVRGERHTVDTLELIETSGDRTLTRILDANAQRKFGPEERLDLFGLGPE